MISSNKAERIIPLLAEYIEQMGLEVGDRLPTERELCEILNVGNTSLREALIILRTFGIVRVQHGSGWFVGKFDPVESMTFLAVLLPKYINADKLEIVEIRLLIEPIIASKAAKYISEEGLESLKEALQGMNTCLSEDVRDKYSEYDRDFHQILAQECGSSLLAMQSSMMAGLFYSMVWWNPETNMQNSFKQHQQIFEVITNKDPDAAEQAMLNHIQDALKWFLNGLGRVE